MDREKYEIAKIITSEIEDLKRELKSLDGSQWTSGVQLEVKTGYSDMGRDLKARATFNGIVGTAIGNAVRAIVENRISQLEKQFNDL